VLSISLIIGNQAAFAQTDVWAFYNEIGGSSIDAAAGGGASSTVGLTLDPSPDSLGTMEVYQTVANAPGPLTGQLITIKCFKGSSDPLDMGFSGFTFGAGSTEPADCIENTRNVNDLGVGVEPCDVCASTNELEDTELIVVDLTELTNAGYTNFMFRLSSIDGTELGWVGFSDSEPTGTVNDFMGVATYDLNFHDTYVNFPVTKNFVYLREVNNQLSGDILLQQIKAEIIPDIVGGHGGPIDKTALMVTGAQLSASWMIPVLISAIGIGVFVVTRKS